MILFLDDFANRVKPASRWEPAGRILELNSVGSSIWQAIYDLVAARILDPIECDGSPFHPWHVDGCHRLNRRLAAEYAAPVLRFCAVG